MRRTTTLLAGAVLISLFLVLPVTYGFGTINAIKQLQFSNPQISVSRDGWNLKVSVSIDISNPTNSPIPSITIVSKVTLDGHILFDAMQNNIGSLDPKQTMTFVLSTTVNLDLLVDLVAVLLDYLEGKKIDYYAHFALTMHYLFDFTIADKTLSGTWTF